jgi:hypothetical protein
MNDDAALCDVCCTMFPDGYPDRFYAPWPVGGPVLVNGCLTADRRNNFGMCESCLQHVVLRADLPLDGRETALASAARWKASQALLGQAEAVVRPPRAPRRQGAA